MHARHGLSRSGMAGLLRLPPADVPRGLRLQRRLLTGYLLASAVTLKVSVLLEAERVLALAVIVAVTVVVVGQLVLGWAWERLWGITLVSIAVAVLAPVVMPGPLPALGFLFAVLAKASLDPARTRACALCGGALGAYLLTAVLVGAERGWDAAAWWVALAPAPAVAVSIASLRLYTDALAQRDLTVRRLELSAQCDPLTGAASRDFFVTQLTHATTDIPPTVRPAVLMLDLDRFKAVNDTFGHRVGDELLRVVTDRLRNAVGDEGVVARLGGDEFAILLPDTTTGHAMELLGRLHESLARPESVVGVTLQPGASIGLAIRARGEPVSPSALLHRADLDMYVSKRRRQDTGPHPPRAALPGGVPHVVGHHVAGHHVAGRNGTNGRHPPAPQPP